MQTTIRAKIKNKDIYSFLDAMAGVLEPAKRGLFKDFVNKERSISEIKKEALPKYEITARQFNSLSSEIRGTIGALTELEALRIEKLKRKIKRLKKKLKSGDLSNLKVHHTKRQLKNAELQLEKCLKHKGTISVCFGTKKLFKKQFNLEENGYTSHEEWKVDWQFARTSHFFLIGSKDESFGNQSCQIMPGYLKLRLTNGLAKKHGTKTVKVPIEFTYGNASLNDAIASGQALSYQFIKKDKHWYVHVSFDLPSREWISHRSNGALGIDLNPGCIALAHIGPDGNLLKSWNVPLSLRNRRSNQIEATFGEEIAKITAYAVEHKIPIVIEKLDFQKKKEELRSRHLNRMLSNFAYALFARLIGSQCFKAGIQLKNVNPAYTSIIGGYKFQEGYGLSSHMAAAMAIARRGLGFCERLRAKAKVRRPLPVRNRERHVWSDWRRLNKEATRSKALPRRQRSKRTYGDNPSSSSATYASGAPPAQGLG